MTSKPNWPQVASFLGLTFVLSWLADLALYLNGGLTHPAGSLLLQFQMLLPAFSAMLLGAFFFKESPIYHRNNHRTSRWFVYFYLLLTVLYLAGVIAAFIQPAQAVALSSLLLIPNMIGLILLVRMPTTITHVDLQMVVASPLYVLMISTFISSIRMALGYKRSLILMIMNNSLAGQRTERVCILVSWPRVAICSKR